MGKLVRDRIPEIMRREGKAPDVGRVSGDRRRGALKDEKKVKDKEKELEQAGPKAKVKAPGKGEAAPDY